MIPWIVDEPVKIFLALHDNAKWARKNRSDATAQANKAVSWGGTFYKPTFLLIYSNEN
jgi:hypothetical protein